MGLLSPWFLAGLAALGLPLWLHLLRQFKRTPRPFSSLMFFERRVQSSTKHRRLRYLALLFARLALLSLLALAFANPFLYRKSDAVSERVLHVIAVDRSFSMRARGRMEEAKAVATRIVNGLAGGSRIQVVAFDSSVEAMSSQSTEKQAARSAINSIDAGDAASSYGELNRALRVLEQSSGMALRVHVVTDAQQTSMPASFADLQPGPHTTEEISTVGTKTANLAVESVNSPARIFGSQPATIAATVRSWNGNDTTQKVSLFMDGRLIASKQVTVPACGSGTVQFDKVLPPYGVHRAEVRLEAADDLPNDNRFLFSIERSDPRRVLFLYASGRIAQSFYYKSALEASADSGLLVRPAALERLTDQNLSNYAFVVLHDPGRLGDASQQALMAYVRKGGALLVAVGPATIAAGNVPVLGRDITRTGNSQTAGDADTHAPAIAGWTGAKNVQFLETPRIDTGNGDRVLARFADGSPLLLEERAGEGLVLVFASTLDNSSSDFPLHSSYLPFVITTARYLAGELEAPSSVTIGTPISLRQSREESTAADVIGPEGRHELSLQEATRAMTYEPPREGYYDIQRANGRHLLLAVHADRRESDLTPIPAETLELWRRAASNNNATETGQQAQKAVPWSLWRYALALVLIAAILESMLASRYLRQKEVA